MKNKWPAIVLLLSAIAALATLVIWRGAKTEAPPPAAVSLPCPSPAAGCAIQIGKRAIRVGLSGTLKPLKPFQVWVSAPGADEVKASFTMVGMNMGFNHYTLRPDSAGVFRAQVTLPTCISDRRDWVMTLDIDTTTRLAMPFATEL